MPLSPFIGKSQAWLEAELAKVQADIAAGRTITSVGSGDVSTGKEITMNVFTRLELILAALNVLDPTNYPALTCTPSTRTKVRFS